ncbi:hypothetical protein HYC85_023121 [Camellia sinensis]|uniref:Uncharacterized protein n=1 Tax=Camellia sinensis TaxID=4442 RepID=A0A7J7GDM9_CAMSI|nr:hypothetical protein HYC85_023121 [Camellia sinensis]
MKKGLPTVAHQRRHHRSQQPQSRSPLSIILVTGTLKRGNGRGRNKYKGESICISMGEKKMR